MTKGKWTEDVVDFGISVFEAVDTIAYKAQAPRSRIDIRIEQEEESTFVVKWRIRTRALEEAALRNHELWESVQEAVRKKNRIMAVKIVRNFTQNREPGSLKDHKIFVWERWDKWTEEIKNEDRAARFKAAFSSKIKLLGVHDEYVVSTPEEAEKLHRDMQRALEKVDFTGLELRVADKEWERDADMFEATYRAEVNELTKGQSVMDRQTPEPQPVEDGTCPVCFAEPGQTNHRCPNCWLS